MPSPLYLLPIPPTADLPPQPQHGYNGVMKREQQDELTTILQRYAQAEGINTTAIPALSCFKASTASLKIPAVYHPSLCVIVQGAKTVLLQEELYHYGVSEYLVVSVDLPVVGQITIASAEQPYLCIQLSLEQDLLHELLPQLERKPGSSQPSKRGLFVGTVDESLVDALLRLVRLLNTPEDIPFLAPLIIRELYYRLLRSEQGHQVTQLVIHGSNMQRIAQAIHLIQENFTKPIRVETMAELVHMSPSSFHHYFKEVTAMSPLQYQKRLRLLEARRLLLTESTNATHTAYQVGYESSSQFSREYTRMFGTPPITDMERIRAI
ncbi:MAG: AraC family transcriptional regulator [Caldilineaceae bacterium]|nr:AraC family transcriptional regulator [Caldilineaceae bacterium]